MLTEVKSELESIKKKIQDLKTLLSIEEKKSTLKELQIKTSETSFWSDKDKAQKTIEDTKNKVSGWKAVASKYDISKTEQLVMEKAFRT